MLDGKEVDVETALEEARRLGRRSMILFAVAGAIAILIAYAGFQPGMHGTPLQTLLARLDVIVVVGLLGAAVSFFALNVYTHRLIKTNRKAVVFSRREKLGATMISWFILATGVILVLLYRWGPNFI